MTTERKVIRAKVGLLELAKQLGNVSQACKIRGTRGTASIVFRSFTRRVARSPWRRSLSASRSRRTASRRRSRAPERMLALAAPQGRTEGFGVGWGHGSDLLSPASFSHAVWLYLRFTLSYRDVEELLAERGLDLFLRKLSQLGAQIRTGDRSGPATVPSSTERSLASR